MPKPTGRGSPSAKMKRALRVKDGEVCKKNAKVVSQIKRKLWARLPTKVHPNRKAKFTQLIPAVAEHLAGETVDFVEKKYKLSAGCVADALNMFFPSSEQREEALSNLMLDNAITSAVIFKKKAYTLTARDAALTAGIFTQRHIELKKARQSNFQQEIPVSLVLKLEETMQRAKQIHGKTIDID